MSKRNKQSQKRLNSLILLIAFTAILLIVSTYAWFSTQNDVYLTGLEGKVEVAKGLQISLDAEKWGQTVDISDASLTEANAITNINDYIVSSTGMIPVSCDGTFDASSTGLTMVQGEFADNKIKNVAAADEATSGKYYAFDMFLLNTSNSDAVSDDLLLNFGSSVVPTNVYATNSGTGLENSVRVGFALASGTAGISSAGFPSQSDILTATVTGSGASTIKKTSIWEPNADSHITAIYKNKRLISLNNSTNSTNTLFGAFTFGENAANTAGAGYQFVSFGESTQIPTFAVARKADGNYGSGTDHVISNVYQWEGNADLAEQKTVKTAKDKNSVSAKETVNLTTVAETPANFTIKANAVSRVRVYVWLEGQDVDAQNVASFGGKLHVDMGLEKSATSNTSDNSF